MTEKEIEDAIRFWNIEDEFYNFDSLYGKYATYCMICFFENKRLKVTRIKNNKCEVKVIKPRSWVKFTLVLCSR